MKTISVGRSPENDLIVQDVLVSSKHLLITQDHEGIYWIEDLNSTNGTWVGKEFLREGRQVITLDTILKIGDTVLVWQPYFLSLPAQPQEVTPLPAQPKPEEITSPLPAPTAENFSESHEQASITRILYWTAIGMGAFFVFLVLFWYMGYVKKP